MYELAIYGGTFDPVHNGHVRAAKAFFDAVKPDKLLIIPTLIPPHKQARNGDSPALRLKMLELAFKDDPYYNGRLTVSDYELNAPPPSYTVNTLRHFKTADNRITFLVGTDMFLTLEKWKDPEEIFSMTRIAFMRRENINKEIKALIDEKLNIYRNKYNADILVLNEEPIEISSSDIRNGTDELRKKYLPSAVYDFIKENNIYGTE